MRIGSFATLIIFGFGLPACAQQIFSDGQSHTVEGFIADRILVSDDTTLVYSAELSRESVFAVLPDEEAEEILSLGFQFEPAIDVVNSQLIVENGRLDCAYYPVFPNLCASTIRADASTVEMRSGETRTSFIGVLLDNASLLKITGGTIGVGAEANTFGVQANNGSQIQMSGGLIRDFGGSDYPTGVTLSQGSELGLSSGRIEAHGQDKGWGIVIEHGSAIVSGGEISADGQQSAFGITVNNGELLMTGGDVMARGREGLRGAALEATGASRIEIAGGVLNNHAGSQSAVYLAGTTEATISGGSISMQSDGFWNREEVFAMEVVEDAVLTLRGGEFTATLGIREEGVEYDFLVMDRGTVQIEGSGFNYPIGQPIEDLTGTVTGIWPDGSSLELDFKQVGSDATILLIPEPSAITLSVTGFLGLLGCRRKKNAA